MTPRFAYEEDSIPRWDALHRQARFRPRYPSDHTVRFALAHFPTAPRGHLRALDIGVGGGRHTRFFCELGFATSGVDISVEGLRHCCEWLAADGYHADLRHGSMSALPFDDATFDAALSFGVYYYADRDGMDAAVAELHRVLRPGGHALVVVRTPDDYRYGKGTRVAPHTFRIEIDDTNERGSVMRFVDESELPTLFRAFSALSYERTDTTFRQRQAVNSDWLVQVTK